MSGYLRVHRAGLEACTTPDEEHALLWLANRGAALGYAPFPASDGYLQQCWGKGRTWCRCFLTAMVAAGVVVVVDPGGRHQVRRIRVVDPTPPKKGNEGGNGGGGKTTQFDTQSPDLAPTQRKAGGKKKMHRQDPNYPTYRGSNFRRCSTETRPDQTTVSPLPPTPGSSPGLSTDLADLADFLQGYLWEVDEGRGMRLEVLDHPDKARVHHITGWLLGQGWTGTTRKRAVRAAMRAAAAAYRELS